MIAIVNYNMGNLGSVYNAFEKIGAKAVIESNPDKLKEYDKLILPGVGAFGDAMEHLNKSGLKEAILDFAKSGKFVMGTCLGMQLLFESSQEFGKHEGLGLIEGKVVPFDKSKFDNPNLKVPHMGWNEMFTINKGLTPNVLSQSDETFAGLTIKNMSRSDETFGGLTQNKIFKDMPDEFYLYFVHSYHVECDEKYAIGKTIYGYEFVSAVNKDNIYGFQPHPEKSHNVGLKILENFVKM